MARHAYGEDDDVPALVAGLGSADPEVRADARHWLRAALCHQRTRYPATRAAVPALAAVALDPGAPERTFALDLLADFAVGDADAWLLGQPDPQAATPEIEALRAALSALAWPHHDPRPEIRARAARAATVLGLPVPGDDPAPAVRACRTLGGRLPAPEEADDADPWVAAAAADALDDAAGAAGVARAGPPVDPSVPWLGGDAVRLAIRTLARLPGVGARDALAHLVAHGDDARAAAALLPAVKQAAVRLAPRGGWPPGGAPPELSRVAAALLDRPWLATPEAWSALEAAGLPGDPDALARHLGRPLAPSVLQGAAPDGRTWREVGRGLGRRGAGGPTVRRTFEGAVLSTVLGSERGGVPASRPLAVRTLGAAGGAAVDVLLALAEEERVPLEALLPAVERAVAVDAAAVRGETARWAAARRSPAVRYDRSGAVVAHHAQVLLLAAHTRASEAVGEPPDPAIDPLVDAGLEAAAFHAEVVRWTERAGPGRAASWARDALARRPGDVGGRALVAALAALSDAEVAAALPRLDPGAALVALPPRRVPALAAALVARLDAFLVERQRWMRDAVGEEVARLAAAAREKGPAAGRALRAAGPRGWAAAVLEVAGPLPAKAAARGRPSAPEGDADAGEAARELSHAVVELVLEEPLLGWLLGHLERVFTTDTPTMGLHLRPAGRTALLVNPGWFTALPGRRMRSGVLRHEVLHLLFGQPFRTDLAQVEASAFATAADLVVNAFPGRWPLPGDARRHPWGEPPVDPHATLDETYRVLLDRRLRAAESAPTEIWHSDHRYWRGTRADGDRGTAAGDVADAAAAWDGLVSTGVDTLGGDALWGLDPGLRAAVLASVERHRTGMDWRRVLRAFAASSRRTTLHHTLKRRSRRYGTFPGIRVRRHHRLAVAVDTSGSIGLPLLQTFFQEIDAIHRSGSEVVVVECDAAVQRTWAYRGQPPEEVHGRGGTAFEPVMSWLHGPDVGRFDGLVYLTDGEGPAPTTPPPCGVLWVLTPEGTAGDHLRFGRAVRIPPGTAP